MFLSMYSRKERERHSRERRRFEVASIEPDEEPDNTTGNDQQGI